MPTGSSGPNQRTHAAGHMVAGNARWLLDLSRAMLRYGINDIRLFYENEVRFLRQF